MIYLDHASTTATYPHVAAAMLSALTEQFGNPSSLHRLGASAAELVNTGRAALASATGSTASGWIFTSGGTEANALALLGTMGGRRRRLLLSAFEHASVAGSAKALESRGITVERLGIHADGIVDLTQLDGLLAEPVDMISVMLANNVVGTVQPVSEIAALVRARWPRCIIHCDAVQALKKMPFTIAGLGVDLLSVSAHKIGGPKGVGALYCSDRVTLKPLITGGGQQGDRRSGTENVPGIVGLTAALKTAYDVDRVADLRDALWSGLAARIPGIVRLGDPQRTLCSHLAIDFGRLRAQILLHHLEAEQIFASEGSACSSNRKTRDPTLDALRVPADHGIIRFSLGPDTTSEEIAKTVTTVPPLVTHLREMFEP